MTKDARFWYFGDGRLRFIKRLFREWHKQLSAFEEEHRDLPYWYGERTNVGVLTAAALRLKGTTALEEYATPKGGRKASRAGRADLYVYDGEARRSYDFEFKLTYSAIGWKSQKRVESAMESAARDVKALPKPTWPCHGLAVTFAVAYCTKTPSPERWDEEWKKFCRFIGVPSRFGADFVAVHQAPYEVVKRATAEASEKCHPGVAAIGRVVRRYPL